MAPKGISRRAFLYDAASAVAFASISGPSALAQTRNRGASIPAGERPLSASHWGVFRAGEIGDCFSWVMPWKNDSHANSMILRAAPEAAYSRSRIRYPMVRQGYLRDGHRSDTAERGRGRFVRVSWDHALDLVVRELKRVKEEFGNAAFYGGSYGWQSKGNLHDSQALLHRMLNLHGGMTDGMGDYSATCSAVVLPHVVGAVDVYEQSTVWPVILENTTLVVIWGADPLELTSYPEQVFIQGEAVPMQSRQTLLRDRYLQTDTDKPPAFRN